MQKVEMQGLWLTIDETGGIIATNAEALIWFTAGPDYEGMDLEDALSRRLSTSRAFAP